MRKPHEQLDYEERRERYEKARLQGYALLKAMDLATATVGQLRAAASLADHDNWDLSRVGRAAERELRKRGL